MPLQCVEIETAPAPAHAIVWLHGLGADGHDFAPVVPQLVDPAWPPLRFVFPHAPVRPVTINNGVPMRAWYDIRGMQIADRQDEAGIRASIEAVEELLAREVARGIAPDKLLLAGFSQGGAVALASALRHARRLAGVIGLSTYLPLADRIMAERSEANAGLPVFLCHGSEDAVVPEALGLLSRDTLQGAGYAVAWHSYPMAHQVCAGEIADLRAWIGDRLQAGRAPRG